MATKMYEKSEQAGDRPYSCKDRVILFGKIDIPMMWSIESNKIDFSRVSTIVFIKFVRNNRGCKRTLDSHLF